MVLSRAGVALGLVVALVGGCSESLFGSHPARDGDGGVGVDGAVADSCVKPCLGDAAGEFDGSQHGKSGAWRYLEDNRDRSWSEMLGSGTDRTGRQAGNAITSCAAHPSAPACARLAGAMLLSSAGGASTADPALELQIASNHAARLDLQVLSVDVDQLVRVYRNAREDALFTATARAGQLLAQTVTLDALAGDRFLVSVGPTGAGGPGAAQVGVKLFASDTGAFPSSCQLAIPFDIFGATSTADVCKGGVISDHTTAAALTAPVIVNGPIPEYGHAADLKATNYFVRDAGFVSWASDVTAQLWVKLRGVPTAEAYLFSDLDPDYGAGLNLSFIDVGGRPSLHVVACNGVTGAMNIAVFGDAIAAFPNDGAWHLVRAVRAGGQLRVCVDGVKLAGYAVHDPLPQNPYLPYLGSADLSTNPSLDAMIDDVRVVNGALPCGP